MCSEHLWLLRQSKSHTQGGSASLTLYIASIGKQAEVLNILLEDLLEGHAVSETKLKEVLGHTPIQVITMLSMHCLPQNSMRHTACQLL